VDSYAAGPQALEAVEDEFQPELDRAEVLEGARRPSKVKNLQIRGDIVHIGRTTGNQPIKGLTFAYASVVQVVSIGHVLVGIDPARLSRTFDIQVCRNDFASVACEKRWQRFQADSEA
jgi:hypothetical protein